jgi:hypothetical protein
MVCLLCGGTGIIRRDDPELPAQEVEEMGVAMITVALDHLLADRRVAATQEELLAVMGDAPLRGVVSVLGVVCSIAAYIIDGFSSQAETDPREYWQRIAQHVLSPEEEP